MIPFLKKVITKTIVGFFICLSGGTLLFVLKDVLPFKIGMWIAIMWMFVLGYIFRKWLYWF